MTPRELWNRLVLTTLAMPPLRVVERLLMLGAALVMTGWFLIDGLPHALWSLPWGMALFGTASTAIELLILALNDDNFDDGEDEEDGDSGWELRA